MSYYGKIAVAKLNEKEEKENGIDSHLRSLIGKKFKKDSDLERAVKQAISAKISDWNGSKMTVFDKQTDEKYILITEDNNKYGTEQEFWISKVEKTNSKEEQGYYAKIVEQKHNASESDIRAMYAKIQELKKKGVKGENIDKFLAAVNYRQAAEQHRKKFKETGEVAYKWAAEKADKQADQWIAEVNRSINK